MNKLTRYFMLGLWLMLPSHSACASVESWMEKLDESLSVQSPGGFFRADLSGAFDFEVYGVEGQAPGLIFGDESFVNPRLALFLDTRLGDHLYGFLQARIDRGIDPRVKKQDARLDEYVLGYRPLEDGRLKLQVGKFATVMGNWVRRHMSWDNPFVTEPVPYNNFTVINDQRVLGGPAALLSLRQIPDNKRKWLPVLWGPVYTTGASVSGRLAKFDYAFAIKNASPSSRPAVWRASQRTWQDPTYSGRLGFRPNELWDMGLSASYGPYLLEGARATLSPNTELDDYPQWVLAQDVSFSRHRLEVWAEVFLSRFDVPNVGHADTLAYYLEAKYKLPQGFFLAARWNQQLFGKVQDGAGGEKAWDRNMFRTDFSLGYRITRHLQAKLQYSFSHQKGERQQGQNLGVAQITARF
ncbi:MAG: hypothetical protein Q8R76_07115 [Candidatus Omnitrophota bacterium]|nr:hypothetical protein [Candidatus Omnitrophota bacterium]